MEDPKQFLRERLDGTSYSRIMAIPSRRVVRFVAESVQLCNPKSVFVCTDHWEDIARIREMALKTGEETALEIEGHTVHFDGFRDQARDTLNTRYLVPAGETLDENLNQCERMEGLREVKGFLTNIMQDKEMIIRFFVLGVRDSPFSILSMQITDSYYVAHSEDLLYRAGYEQFKRMETGEDFFKVLHSAGRLENAVSVDVGKRRVFIDYSDETVYSVNTQYAGNTVGFKKLSLRLAIRKSDREHWLAEHMFLMGVHGPKGRVTYFSGAFPSGCGKTSTSMMPGETIVGDDLAYLKKFNGKIYAANVECGIFGIIRNVNPHDDPIIWDVLNQPGEVIFSNVLVKDGVPYWIGDNREHPKNGVNHAGMWHKGMRDDEGNKVPLAHRNARYTIRLCALPNLDKRAESSKGVPLGGIIYGGRDADTWVPVQQSFNWIHGVVTMGASLESETTAATLGKEGVRAFQPFSNMDFISIPLGNYIQNHFDFVKDLEKVPPIFAVNYFIKGTDGEYLNSKLDKRVWLKWMELRVHNEVDAVDTPTGYIPRYEDLKQLFQDVLDKDYTIEEYERQFEMRIPELLAKLDRIEQIYHEQVKETPDLFFEEIQKQRYRLKSLQKAQGDCVSPSACCEFSYTQ